MGRSKKENSFNKTVAFKITKEQKEILDKNKWIKDELKQYIRDYLDMFKMN